MEFTPFSHNEDLDSKKLAEFYDQAAKEWDIDGISEERLEINNYFLNNILHNVTTILDVGCGGGALSNYYAKKGHEVVSIDISPKMIEHGINEYGSTNPTFLVKDITDDFNNLKYLGVFDLVMLCDSLEHVLSVEDALHNSIKMVNSGGYIYLTFPHPLYRMNRGFEGQIVDNVLDIDWIKHRLTSHGFVILNEKGYGHDWGKFTTYYGILTQKSNIGDLL